jgi:colicin-E5 Imm protein
MMVNRQKLYDRAKDFFDLGGNAVMKLSRKAATDACRDAALQGLLVVKIEGGIWNNGTFEARLDAIWDGTDPPTNAENARRNNLNAADFIRSQDDSYNAFIITASGVTGYQHRIGVDPTAAK